MAVAAFTGRIGASSELLLLLSVTQNKKMDAAVIGIHRPGAQ
jgi:predicted Rossmann-fold nucleotide-binding protein